MNLDRRGLLGLLGAGATSACASAPATAPRPIAFRHGVASGDPDQTSAVFWTRVTPLDGAAGDIAVTLEVARDMAFQTVVIRSAGLAARSERDFTVKHDLNGRGLEPGQEYVYRFTAEGVTSPVGRVRTLPAGPTADVVLAVASCQLHPGGLFNAYEAMAGLERLDAVVHLGDYIYEYGADPDAYGMVTGAPLNRVPEPAHEIVSLADYRTRHAQYKADPDLQAAHARAAFICVWDDHEVANDSWRAGAANHQPETEGDFAQRKAAALRAYYEWMPIREPRAGALKAAVNRVFHFGDLATLIMVETRLLARTKPLSYADLSAGADGQPDIAAFRARLDDPSRELLGEDQRQWLGRELASSKAAGRAWQVLGNQVVTARVRGPDVERMMPADQIAGLLVTLPENVRAQVQASIQLFRLGLPFNLDSWDGYPAARERLYDIFREAGAEPIVLAGDSHAFWVNELHDAGGERRAVEFGVTAISSPSPGDFIRGLPLGQALVLANPEEVRLCDQTAKGFLLLTLTPTSARADLMAVSTILAKPFQVRTSVSAHLSRTPAGTKLQLLKS